MRQYSVQQGDCMESIAAQFGFTWETLWNHPSNQDLRTTRGCPNVLLPGDIVSIPDLTLRIENCCTHKCHNFILNSRQPSKLVIVLKDFDQPRANETYILTVKGGKTVKGTTDANGRLEETIPPGAQSGKLLVGPPEAQEEYILKLGHIDPIDQPTGVEGRLRNLGYRSLAEFQKKYFLPETNKVDDTTLQILRQEYGC